MAQRENERNGLYVVERIEFKLFADSRLAKAQKISGMNCRMAGVKIITRLAISSG